MQLEILPIGECAEPSPTTQSPIFATRRIAGLQIASVQSSQNGLGAAPSS